jgi:hypothetical protein
VPIPERCLASAVIKQALHDFQRGHPEAQEEVAQWLQDLKAVSFWSDMIDVDAEGFRDVIARTRRC